MLREPLSLLMAGVIVLASVATVAARQGFQTSYQGSMATTLGATRPRLQTMSGAISEFQSGGIGEDLLRVTLSTSDHDTAAALEPLTSMPELRGTFLDESDAAAHHASLALRAELDELDLSLEQHEGLTQVAYRAQRVLSLAGQPGSGLTLESSALTSARRLWLQSYARDLSRYDADLQARVDDLIQWRTQKLPTATSDEINARVADARLALQLGQDRVRALPTPPDALRPDQDYTVALGHLDRALQALGSYASAQTPANLQALDQELSAYRSGRGLAGTAISQLARPRGGQ